MKKDRILVIYKKDSIPMYTIGCKVAEVAAYKYLDPETTIIITDDIVTEQFIRENCFNVVILMNSNFECNFYDIVGLRKIDLKVEV